jgi:hypothetical protein
MPRNLPFIINTGQPSSQTKNLLLTAGLVAALYMGKQWYDEYKKRESYNIALNPSGLTWLRYFDGKDEKVILDIAREITNLGAVQQAYKDQTGRELFDDLKLKLSPETLQAFNTITARAVTNTDGKGGKPANFKAPAGTLLLAKSDTNLRKTPALFGNTTTDKLFVYLRSNVITLIPAGMGIGVATGITQAATDGTLFLQVKIVRKDVKAREFYLCWVAASQVQPVSLEEFRKKNPRTISITKAEYEAASSVLQGFSDYQVLESKILL